MAKRKPLSFDNGELTKNLKESAGNGLDAFFSTTPLPQAVSQKTGPKKETKIPTEIKQESKKAKKGQEEEKVINMERVNYERKFVGEKGKKAVVGEIAQLQTQLLSELEEIAIRVGKDSMGGPGEDYVSEKYQYLLALATPLVEIKLNSATYLKENEGTVSLRIKHFGDAGQIAPLVELAKKYELELKK